jgi:hypothetical protein
LLTRAWLIWPNSSADGLAFSSALNSSYWGNSTMAPPPPRPSGTKIRGPSGSPGPPIGGGGNFYWAWQFEFAANLGEFGLFLGGREGDRITPIFNCSMAHWVEEIPWVSRFLAREHVFLYQVGLWFNPVQPCI